MNGCQSPNSKLYLGKNIRRGGLISTGKNITKDDLINIGKSMHMSDEIKHEIYMNGCQSPNSKLYLGKRYKKRRSYKHSPPTGVVPVGDPRPANGAVARSPQLFEVPVPVLMRLYAWAFIVPHS